MKIIIIKQTVIVMVPDMKLKNQNKLQLSNKQNVRSTSNQSRPLTGLDQVWFEICRIQEKSTLPWILEAPRKTEKRGLWFRKASSCFTHPIRSQYPYCGIFCDRSNLVTQVQHGLSPSGNLINMHKIGKIASDGFNSQLLANAWRNWNSEYQKCKIQLKLWYLVTAHA